MTNLDDAPMPVLYGRFSVRLRAFFIDQIVVMAILAAALTIATAADSDQISRILGATVVFCFVLLEPVLVSVFGSTVGHYFNNLRVVDDRTKGRVRFLKALARVVIKTVLGLYSFVTMATTSRHQALHDWLTRSTVQIRDTATARPADYVNARIATSEMPSGKRRLLAVVAHLLLGWLALGTAMGILVSQTCLMRDVCSLREDQISQGAGLIALIFVAIVVVLGWRGRLLGARRAKVAQV